MENAVRKPRSKPRRRPPRTTLLLRWLAVGGVLLLALLYYRPLKTYLAKRHEVAQRQAEVAALRATHRALERRVAGADAAAALTRQARRLGFVKPGERLFIVKGIASWERARSTIAGGGR